ncbi:hypothetical protein INT45_000497 [Circinella minor]|uniref:Uncharacterized protein n=1 Tax=Circinella minor TaxID=1195481 RepID=A0A8H7S710_9FUNG|nr:hypothetical protein INT45_000497 [Circinella minor]
MTNISIVAILLATVAFSVKSTAGCSAQPTPEGGYIDVAKVGTEVPAQPGKHSLKLPANIATNNNYVIILGNSTDPKCISGSFFIEPGSDTTPIVPEEPVAAPGNEQKPLPPFPSNSLVVPSNVGTPASSVEINPIATESSETIPMETSYNNEVSHTVGHGAVKTDTPKASAAISRDSVNLFYVVKLFMFMIVVVDIMSYL